jgi:hypothetical protein
MTEDISDMNSENSVTELLKSNRCIAYNKNNNKCRSKTKDGSLFCCKSHEPLNKEMLTDGCFLCMEKIDNKNNILYFKCRHIVHKPCYNEWLQFSTYESPICIICRKNTYTKKEKEQKIKKIKTINHEDMFKINCIKNILYFYPTYNIINIPDNYYTGNTATFYFGNSAQYNYPTIS